MEAFVSFVQFVAWLVCLAYRTFYPKKTVRSSRLRAPKSKKKVKKGKRFSSLLRGDIRVAKKEVFASRLWWAAKKRDKEALVRLCSKSDPQGAEEMKEMFDGAEEVNFPETLNENWFCMVILCYKFPRLAESVVINREGQVTIRRLDRKVEKVTGEKGSSCVNVGGETRWIEGLLPESTDTLMVVYSSPSSVFVHLEDVSEAECQDILETTWENKGVDYRPNEMLPEDYYAL